MAELTAKRLLCLALALLLLGACLLLCARGPLSDETAVKTPLAGGTLYLPERALQGEVPAVLMTHAPGDGGMALVCELLRRNTAVLLLPDSVPLRTGWDALCEQDFVRMSALGLLVRGSRTQEAAALAEELSGGGREPGAVIVLGAEAELTAFTESPARNMLFLSGQRPSAAALAAFYGNDTPAGRISGYFGEGTAKAVHLVSGAAVPRYSGTATADNVTDWLGSSLGHVSGIPDGDLLVGRYAAMNILGGVCMVLAAAGAVIALRKRRHHGS